MITFDMNCENCKHSYETTWGDICICDLDSTNQIAFICSLYKEEITENLKEKCYRELSFEYKDKEGK